MMTILVATIAWLVISVVWTNDYYAFSKGARDGAEAHATDPSRKTVAPANQLQQAVSARGAPR